MGLSISGTAINEDYVVVIDAKTAAETTALIELRNYINYSFSCTALGSGEEILVEIYDVSKSAWQPYMVDGDRVKMAQGYEQLLFRQVSAVIRFVKSVTVATVGLVISHPK